MVKLLRTPAAGVAMICLLLALVIWRGVMAEFRLDDSFITYRYAQNFAEGRGLVFNAGDAVLSTTAPLYAMLLGLFSRLIPDFHTLGGLISTGAIAAGGALIFVLLPSPMPRWIRAWASVAYVLSTPFWLALGMETALWIALVLCAVYLFQQQVWFACGLVVGLAVLVRPDALLPGGLLGLSVLVLTINRVQTMHTWWRPLVQFVAALAIPLLIFGLWSWVVYGSPFPVTLSAKSAQAEIGITGLGVGVTYWEGLRLILRSLFTQSALYVVFGLLILFGLIRTWVSSVLLIACWGVLHLLAYVILGVAPYRWYYAPLVPAAILLAAYGLDYIRLRLTQQIAFSAALVVGISIFPLIAQIQSFGRITQQIREGGLVDVMLPIVDWQVYQETGEWLQQNTPLGSTVGVAEVGQLGFFAERTMTDYLGLLQPDVTAMLRRGDLYSWLVAYAPDYLVFQRFRGAALVLYNHVIQDDPWFNALYAPTTEFDDVRYPAGPVTIFQRGDTLRPLAEFQSGLEFGGLRLRGYATDGDSIPGSGGTVRVRLDWDVVGALPENLHIAVKGLDMNGENPAFDGDYQTVNWGGQFSTWHGFVVRPGVVPRDYVLLVGVGPTGGPYLEQGIGSLRVVIGS
jgi:hypothetical protein